MGRLKNLSCLCRSPQPGSLYNLLFLSDAPPSFTGTPPHRMQHNFRLAAPSVCRAADPTQWAAAQATHSLDKGCAVFSVKVLQAGECAVGWGAVDSQMTLGRTLTSFGLYSDGVAEPPPCTTPTVGTPARTFAVDCPCPES